MENTYSTEYSIGKSNKKIDDITLQLLTSKNNYKKCLKKTNNQEFIKLEENLSNISQYKDKIIKLTTDRLDNYNIMISHEMDEAFNHYIDTCVRYFKMKEIELKNEYYKNNEEEEDITIFSNWKDSSSEECRNSEQYTHLTPVLNHNFSSFWGKKISKNK